MPEITPMPAELIEPRIARALRKLSRATSALPVIAGVLVLAGWWLHIEFLKSIVPGLVAMNPVTAIGFICIGASLILLTRHSHRFLANAFASIAMFIGIAKAVALLSLPDLALDRLFFYDQLARNQMAPNTAINFLLIGLALITIDRSFHKIWPAQFLTVVAAMSSLLALMGYAYGVKSFYGIGSYIPMALHTAVTFLLVSIGVLCARPARGIMAVVSSASSGGLMVRRLIPAVLLVPAALGWLRITHLHRRIVDPDFELWLMIIGIMSVFIVLVGWIGRLLHRSDLERVEAERVLAHQATHDPLTQLPNRRLFLERLESELAKKDPIAVLFFDLDQFKIVNDSLGHVVGDELLSAAGKRIREILGKDDLIARLSGDEFVALLIDPNRAAPIAEEALRAFGTPFRLGPHDVFTTISIGIAVSQPDDSAVNLIRHADLAMYQAKARGKARYEVFIPNMDLDAMRRLEMELELRRAIANNELRVYYQPEVEIESGRLEGMEALVRWEHPERGLISPSEFIPIAEESGLVLQIGRFVLFEACRQAKFWEDKYKSPLLVAVNLSGRHFQQATLLDEVSEVLQKTGVNPAHVILEITETTAMAGAESTIEILTKLKSLGVRLAIDDFGTGFSSLSYLKRFPVDLLKIDKSFVDGVALNSLDRAIVQAIIALGHALGMKLIAEGVETAEQLDELRALGSEIGQGYYFGRPLSDKGMPAVITGERRWGVS
ncbi:MAG TPA: EAL domain-containing protein [Thermoanaerobaculia bacterium]|nr:EAL domain-containing protein [Thermoanaerobaculia bacterium]